MKKMLLVMSLFLFSTPSFNKPICFEDPSYTIVTIEHLEQPTYIPKKNWSSLKTVCHACAIGSATGLLAYAISGYLFPFNWYLTYRLRSILIDSVIETARDNNEYINFESISNAAWLADWITYLAAFGVQHKLRSHTKFHYSCF